MFKSRFKKIKVAIVVLHYHDLKLTQDCLKSTRDLVVKGFQLEVIVVDNGSKENLQSLAQKNSDYHFSQTKKNLGFTGGNNLGLQKALARRADWVLLVNNDTILDKRLVVNLLKAAKLDDKIGILGPKIYFAPGHEFHRQRYRSQEKGKVLWYAGGIVDWQNVLSSHRGVDEVDRGQYDEMVETEFVSGCAMMIHKKVLKTIGLLDDKYYLYLEDNDYCQRAKKRGFKVVYAPRAKVWHINAGSSQVGGDLQDYFLTRNRLLFGWRYAPLRSKLALLRESGKLLFKGRPWQKVAVSDFYIRNFRKGSWRG
ncbi:glycosyltransferase family 2 protein [Patescibacteria group bacterium]